jgi:predicted AlkP superfamily pyrophosphatase or phosphodiesterase
MLIHIPVAVAELFDKVSILQIKQRQLTNPQRQQLASNELAELMQIVSQHQLLEFLETEIYEQLLETNQTLWDVCEDRRQSELLKTFDQDFIEKSRLEYKTNDRRASLKQQINQHFGSAIEEVKSYKRFSHEPE